MKKSKKAKLNGKKRVSDTLLMRLNKIDKNFNELNYNKTKISNFNFNEKLISQIKTEILYFDYLGSFYSKLL